MKSGRRALAVAAILIVGMGWLAPPPLTDAAGGTQTATGAAWRPDAATRPEDWSVVWEGFLKRWEEGDGSTAADLFALDQSPGIPGGKITMADALARRGHDPGRWLRLIRHQAAGARLPDEKSPFKMIITVFWTLKPPPAGKPPLVVTEETFDLNVIQGRPTIFDYQVVDRTDAETKTHDKRIKEQQKTYEDAKSPSERLNAALAIAIAQMEMARVADYWETIDQKMPVAAMKPYPETQKSLVDALQRLTADDTVPSAYEKLARDLGYLPAKSPPTTTGR